MSSFKLVLFISGCILPLAGLCQQTSRYRLPNGTMKVFVEPAALIDFVNDPSIRVGVEAPVYKHFAAFATGGIYTSGTYGKAGIKYYGFTQKDPELFFSLCAFYKNNTYTSNDNIRVRDTLVASGYHPGPDFSYEVSKRVKGIHFEIGEVTAGKYFAFEWFAGIGIRVRTALPSVSDSVQYTLYHYHESMTTNFNNIASVNKVYPSLSAGVRLGFIYKRLRNE